MGVQSSALIAEQTRGPVFDEDGSLRRSYTLVFQVITDDTNQFLTGGLQALVQGLAIPPLYSSYDLRPYGGVEYDDGALLVNYDPYRPQADAPNLWYVRCEYKSRSLDPSKVSLSQGAGGSPQGGGGLNENPILRPTKITYRNNSQRQTAYSARGRWSFEPTPFFDSEQKRLMNSAGQAYNPGPEIIVPQKTLTIQRNQPSYNVNDMMYYEGKVNSVPWLGFATGTVLCDFIDGESGFENKVAFVTVTYQFSVRRENFNPDSPGEAWDWAPIDQGTFYVDANGAVQPFADDNGNPQQFGYLDGSGGKLGDGLPPVIYAFRVYDRADFNALHLP